MMERYNGDTIRNLMKAQNVFVKLMTIHSRSSTQNLSSIMRDLKPYAWLDTVKWKKGPTIT